MAHELLTIMGTHCFRDCFDLFDEFVAYLLLSEDDIDWWRALLEKLELDELDSLDCLLAR